MTKFSINFRLIVGDKGSVPLGEVLSVVFANLPLKEDTQEYPVVYRALEAAYQEIKASGILGQNLAKVCSIVGSNCSFFCLPLGRPRCTVLHSFIFSWGLFTFGSWKPFLMLLQNFLDLSGI